MLNRRHMLLTAGAMAFAGQALAKPKPGAAPKSHAAAATAGAGKSGGAEGAKLDKLFDDFFKEYLDESPELVTGLGLDKGERAAAKSQLSDASMARYESDKKLNLDQLRRLKTVDRAKLDTMGRINYDSVEFGMALSADADKRFDYGSEGGGQPYVLSQLTGSYQGTPSFLANQHTIETKEDCDAYLSRLEAFARQMDQENDRVRHDVGLGVVPPDFVIERSLTQMNALKTPAEKSTLVSSLVDRAKAKGIAGDYAAPAEKIYSEKIAPALDRQIALMESLKPKAVHDAGVWRLPDGEAYYQLALEASTTVKTPAAEVHKMGLDQARELSARAEVLFAKIGMTKGTVGERFKALYADPKYRYPNTDEGKEKLISDLNGMVAAMQKRLPQYFGTLPKAPLQIQRVPKFIEAGAPGGYYQNASLDGTRPGIYWINLRDAAEVPSWTLPTLTYHEGIPGHHLQISIAQEAPLPMLRRIQNYSAYAEGWALYTEQLAQEMGVYATDPLGELGYLHDALFRAARLVVDTGLHAMRWSREKAIATMSEIDGDPETAATTEIERYCVWPGQACSYMVGKLTILRLRAKAKAALGPKFDIRKFHDTVLLHGAMPLTVLETAVDGYIASAKKA